MGNIYFYPIIMMDKAFVDEDSKLDNSTFIKHQSDLLPITKVLEMVKNEFPKVICKNRRSITDVYNFDTIASESFCKDDIVIFHILAHGGTTHVSFYDKQITWDDFNTELEKIQAKTNLFVSLWACYGANLQGKGNYGLFAHEGELHKSVKDRKWNLGRLDFTPINGSYDVPIYTNFLRKLLTILTDTSDPMTLQLSKDWTVKINNLKVK